MNLSPESKALAIATMVVLLLMLAGLWLSQHVSITPPVFHYIP